MAGGNDLRGAVSSPTIPYNAFGVKVLDDLTLTAGEPTAHVSTRQLGPCARARSYACRELIQRSWDGAS
eukprot:5438992-Prymnesium_polylepis.1